MTSILGKRLRPRHRELALEQLLDGVDGAEVMASLRKRDGGLFATTSLSTEMSRIRALVLLAGRRSPDYHMSSLKLRRIALEHPECIKFFDLPLEEQARLQRSPPLEWKDAAKQALKSIRLLPPNMSSFKLSTEQSDELHRRQSDALEKKTATLICIPNGDWVVCEAAAVLHNAQHYTVAQLAVTLLLVSGRRSAEILNGRSVFAPRADSHFHALFTGQLKKGTRNADAYTIPLLVPFYVFAHGLQVLRQKQSAIDISPMHMPEEAVHSLFQKRIAGALDGRGKTGLLRSLPFSDATETRHLTPHDLRAVYVALAIEMFDCGYTFPQVAKLILGHQSVTESLHYQTVRVLTSSIRRGPLALPQ